MSLTASQIQLNLLRHSLNTLYTRASAYATRMADMDLDEKERHLLVEQHRRLVGQQAMEDIENVFGGLSITRDPTGIACP